MVQQVVVGHIYEQTGVSGALVVLLLLLMAPLLLMDPDEVHYKVLFVCCMGIDRFSAVNIIFRLESLLNAK